MVGGQLVLQPLGTSEQRDELEALGAAPPRESSGTAVAPTERNTGGSLDGNIKQPAFHTPPDRLALQPSCTRMRGTADQMEEKIPIPCEHCHGTGVVRGIECRECQGRGHRVLVRGKVMTLSHRPALNRPPRRPWSKSRH